MYRQNHYQFNGSFTQTSAPGERSSKTAEWLYFFAMYYTEVAGTHIYTEVAGTHIYTEVAGNSPLVRN